MSEWISVKDRLPDNDRLNVCRYGRRGEGHIGIILSRYYTPSNVDKKVWCKEFGSTQLLEITHWTPLPDTNEYNPQEYKRLNSVYITTEETEDVSDE
jgi:hypothetical protein